MCGCFYLSSLLSLFCETANELADPINEALLPWLGNPFDIPLQNNNIRNRAEGARLLIL